MSSPISEPLWAIGVAEIDEDLAVVRNVLTSKRWTRLRERLLSHSSDDDTELRDALPVQFIRTFYNLFDQSIFERLTAKLSDEHIANIERVRGSLRATIGPEADAIIAKVLSISDPQADSAIRAIGRRLNVYRRALYLPSIELSGDAFSVSGRLFLLTADHRVVFDGQMHLSSVAELAADLLHIVVENLESMKKLGREKKLSISYGDDFHKELERATDAVARLREVDVSHDKE